MFSLSPNSIFAVSTNETANGPWLNKIIMADLYLLSLAYNISRFFSFNAWL